MILRCFALESFADHWRRGRVIFFPPPCSHWSILRGQFTPLNFILSTCPRWDKLKLRPKYVYYMNFSPIEATVFSKIKIRRFTPVNVVGAKSCISQDLSKIEKTKVSRSFGADRSTFRGANSRKTWFFFEKVSDWLTKRRDRENFT